MLKLPTFTSEKFGTLNDVIFQLEQVTVFFDTTKRIIATIGVYASEENALKGSSMRIEQFTLNFSEGSEMYNLVQTNAANTIKTYLNTLDGTQGELVNGQIDKPEALSLKGIDFTQAISI